MTEQQLLEEIKRLSVAERVSLIEIISRTLLEDLEMSGENGAAPDLQGESERRLAAIGRLRGVLKTSGEPPSDEQLKEDYTDYLAEKYS